MVNNLFGDRFDFLGLGPASTNQTATVLACALVSCGWFWLQSKRRWQVLGFVICSVLSVLLVATKSRGGLIAATCGLGLLGGVARPRLSRWVWLSVLAVVGGVIAYGAVRGVWGRFTYGDDSRSDLWRAGLAMLWDFPRGVGAGSTPDVFTQWYQEIGDRRGYLSLINFHLTWLAERGVAARVAYALAWAGLAWAVWPKRSSASSAVAAGVWLAFFVAGIFSTTATVWQLWAIPLSWLVVVAACRIRHRSFAAPRVAGICVGASLLALFALHAVGWHLSSPLLSVAANSVRWGGEPARVVLYDPSPGVLGGKWGHDLRASGASACVLAPGAAIPADLRTDAIWMLSNSLPDRLPPKSHVRLFNLPAAPETLAWLDAQSPASVRVTLSDSLCRELRCEDWFAWADRHPDIHSVKVMGGVGLFIPSWSWFDGD